MTAGSRRTAAGTPLRVQTNLLFPLAALVLLALAPLVDVGDDEGPAPAPAVQPMRHNDAGTGQDAGDSPLHALVVPSAGRVFAGNLTPPGTDVDWYVRGAEGAGSAFCAQSEAQGAVPARLALASDPSRAAEVHRDLKPSGRATLALAGEAGGRPFLGFEPPPSLTMSDGDVRGPGHYTFTLTRHEAAALDPEGDGDVPDGGAVPAASLAVPAPCFAGRVGGADAADHFHRDLAAGDRLLVSLARVAGAAPRLDVLDPAGQVRASLGSGEAAAVWADASGRWVLAVRAEGATAADAAALLAASGDTDYLVGVETDPGSSNPCRPACGAS